MRLRRTLLALMTSAALLVTLAVQAGAASAARYDLQGSYAFTPPGPFCDVFDCGGYAYEGTATCRSRCAGAPQTGVFTLDLIGTSRTWPQNACVAQKVQGELNFQPQDPYLPVATAVFGNNVSDRGFMTRSLPTDPYRGTIHAFVGRPADPCSPGAFTGSVELPPNPI